MKIIMIIILNVRLVKLVLLWISKRIIVVKILVFIIVILMLKDVLIISY